MRIGSAGKTFSLTGWKVGYVTGPARPGRLWWPRRIRTSPSPPPPNLQRAVAVGLAKDDAYFAALAGELQARRDQLEAGCARLGFGTLPARRQLFHHRRFLRPLGFDGDDVAFCRTITEQAGVDGDPGLGLL